VSQAFQACAARKVGEKSPAWPKNSFPVAKRPTFVIRPDGTIKSIFRKVKPGEHADTLLNDLAHFEP
jgi:peroxiredoxin